MSKREFGVQCPVPGTDYKETYEQYVIILREIVLPRK